MDSLQLGGALDLWNNRTVIRTIHRKCKTTWRNAPTMSAKPLHLWISIHSIHAGLNPLGITTQMSTEDTTKSKPVSNSSTSIP